MWNNHAAGAAPGHLFRGAVCALALLVAAGCGRKEEALFAEKTTVAAPAAVGGPPAYVGIWARNAGECAARRFTFTETQLQAPSGSACEVSDAEPSPAGYSLTALCRLKGTETPGRLLLTFEGAGPRNTMTVEGGPLEAPLSLVRCGASAG
jgi:hypothetical protein